MKNPFRTGWDRWIPAVRRGFLRLHLFFLYRVKANRLFIRSIQTDAECECAQSGCDSLAISIGTAHGVYKAKAIPEISFDSLAAIRTATNVPLVLHGGSGSGDDNLARFAREGICKVNIYTDL